MADSQTSACGQYTGELLPGSGVRHGKGKYIFPNRFFSFRGTYDHGIRSGPGILTLMDGSSIEATFVNGEIHLKY